MQITIQARGCKAAERSFAQSANAALLRSALAAFRIESIENNR